jgi:NAD-dependent DNA ligase
MPTVCPSCGSPVAKEEDEAVIRCTNAECPAQILRHLIHFTSRDAMDIEGLGPAVLEQLLNANLISNIVDLYRLDGDKVKDLERIGEKSTVNMLAAIENSKSNDLSKLIFAFGIRHIGAKAAKLLALEAQNQLQQTHNFLLQEVSQQVCCLLQKEHQLVLYLQVNKLQVTCQLLKQLQLQHLVLKLI